MIGHNKAFSGYVISSSENKWALIPIAEQSPSTNLDTEIVNIFVVVSFVEAVRIFYIIIRSCLGWSVTILSIPEKIYKISLGIKRFNILPRRALLIFY
jgi:hypothetical protein